MRLLSAIGIPAPKGWATLELVHGDLTDLPEPVDVLVVSAIAGDYHPVEGTLIQALKARRGVDVASLVGQTEIDLRQAIGIWVSRELEEAPAKRIMGVELQGGPTAVGDALESVFVGMSILEAKGIPVERIALPVLGAGSQGLEARQMIDIMLPAATRFMERSVSNRQTQFVELDEERAELLASTLEASLGRPRLRVPNDEMFEGLRKKVTERVASASSLFTSQPQLRRDWLALEGIHTVRISAFARMVRLTIELMVARLTDKSGALAIRIRDLEQKGIAASWICGYMHVLRHVGNEGAHLRSEEGSPPNLDEDDLVLALYCLDRVMEYWHRYHEPGRSRS